MATIDVERTRTEVEELERLWAAPAARRPHPLLARLPRALAVGWAVFVVAVIVFEPAPNAEVMVPLWAEVTLAGFWTALFSAAMFAWFRRAGPALGASAVAGFVGLAVAYACAATEHHLGSWWLVEAGACGVLGLLSAVALAARR